jgi:cytidylate kinase
MHPLDRSAEENPKVTPRSLEELVNRQALRWETAKKAFEQRSRGGEPLPVAPTIAVSRLPHSGGAALARRIAEELDYGFFGRELIDEIEQAQGVQRSLLEGLDERIRGKIDRYVLDTLRRDSFTESRYLEHLVRTLRTLGERGMLVVLGRGASQILPPERTLRVLVVAPRAFRLDRLARTRGISHADAEARLVTEDRERTAFLRHHFGLTADDPLHYDLVLNTGALSLDGCTRLILDALRDRFPGAKPPA